MKRLKNWFYEDQGEGSLYLSKRQWRIKNSVSFILILIGWYIWSFIESLDPFTFDVFLKIILGGLFVNLGGKTINFDFSYKMYYEERTKEIEQDLSDLKAMLKMI